MVYIYMHVYLTDGLFSFEESYWDYENDKKPS